MDLTPVGSKAFLPHLDSTLVSAKMSYTKKAATESSERKEKHEKSAYQRTPIQTQIYQTHRQAILIHTKIAIINLEDMIIRTSIGSSINTNLSNYEIS